MCTPFDPVILLCFLGYHHICDITLHFVCDDAWQASSHHSTGNGTDYLLNHLSHGLSASHGKSQRQFRA